MKFGRLSLCLALYCLLITHLQAQWLVTFEGPTSNPLNSDPTVTFLDTATLNATIANRITGAYQQFLALPDSTEVYLIANTSGPAITALRPKTKNSPKNAGIQQLGDFANPVNIAALSPDGSRLIVGENLVHIFDTKTNTDLTPNGIVAGDGSPITGIVVSYDSQTAYAVAANSTQTFLTAINIPQLVVANTMTLQGAGTGPVLAPNGLLYVSLPNELLEINPITWMATSGGTIALTGTPGTPVFTPDGIYAVAANQTPAAGPAVWLINLNDHQVAGIVSFDQLPIDTTIGAPDPFTNLYVASPNLLYAFSSGVLNSSLAGTANVLYSLQIGAFGGISLGTPVLPGIDLTSISALTFSNDLGAPANPNSTPPAPARNAPEYLFILGNTLSGSLANYTLYQIDPVPGTITAQVPLLSAPGGVAFFSPTATQNLPGEIFTYGGNQSLLPGQSSLPMVIRVLDQNGLPISGASVNFSFFSTMSTSTINPVNTVTGIDGYAEAIFTAGNTPADIGQQTVTASVTTASGGALQGTLPVSVGSTLTGVATTLSVVEGQGQVIPVDPSGIVSPNIANFIVLAADANGNPVPNTLVTFTLSSGGGTLMAPDGTLEQSVVVPTDISGQASVSFMPPSVVALVPGYTNTTVTASAPTAPPAGSNTPGTVTQTFYATSIPVNSQNCGAPPCPPEYGLTLQVLKPSKGTLMQGPAGSIQAGAVQVYVATTSGYPIPNVSLLMSTGMTDSGMNDASCVNPAGGGVALTNASGVATCDFVFGETPGTQPLNFIIGDGGPGFGTGWVFSGYTVTVLPGTPANVVLKGGDNQNVPTGELLPQPLQVLVTDAHNVPLQGIPVTWKVLSGSFTLQKVTATTNFQGIASASGLVTSSGGSTISVQASAGAGSYTFTILVSVPPAKIAIVSGNNQTAVINTPFTNPLVVQLLDAKGNPAPYSTVTFVSSGAPLVLPATMMVADANGMVTIMVSAGPGPGTATLTAEYAAAGGTNPPSAKFTLNILPVGPENAKAVSSASLQPGIAPGGLVTFLGQGLAPTINGIVTDPTQMAGYTVLIDGNSAPILALVNQNGGQLQQINAQVPFESSTGPVSVVIQTPLGATAFTTPVAELAPTMFTSGTLDAIGGPFPLAAAVRSDGSYVSASNPVQPGEMITLFATGLGETSPLASTGVPGVPGQVVGNTLLADVNAQGVAVVSAVYQPGTLGVYDVTLQIPASAVAGAAQPVGLFILDSLGNSFAAPQVFIPIQ